MTKNGLAPEASPNERPQKRQRVAPPPPTTTITPTIPSTNSDFQHPTTSISSVSANITSSASKMEQDNMEGVINQMVTINTDDRERECEVGIVHFVNMEQKGFSGILKQRYVLRIFPSFLPFLPSSGVASACRHLQLEYAKPLVFACPRASEGWHLLDLDISNSAHDKDASFSAGSVNHSFLKYISFRYYLDLLWLLDASLISLHLGLAHTNSILSLDIPTSWSTRSLWMELFCT